MSGSVDVLLLGVAVVWGSSYLSAKTLVVAGGVLATLALRYLISAGAMAVVAAVRRTPWPSKRELAVGLGLGVTQASVLALETYGVSLTSATNAGLLISLTILLTPMLDGPVSRRWLPPRFFGAAAVAVAGVVLLIGGEGLRTPSAGDALMLAAALVRAAHVTASSRLTRATSMNTVTLTLLQTIVGAVIFAPGVARAVTSFGPGQWLGVLYLALGCSVFAFLVQLWAIRRTSASRASLLLGTEPLWAVLIGVSLGGDTLGPAAAAGVVLVIAGTFWGQRIETRSRLGPAGSTAAGRHLPGVAPARRDPRRRPPRTTATGSVGRRRPAPAMGSRSPTHVGEDPQHHRTQPGERSWTPH